MFIRNKQSSVRRISRARKSIKVEEAASIVEHWQTSRVQNLHSYALVLVVVTVEA